MNALARVARWPSPARLTLFVLAYLTGAEIGHVLSFPSLNFSTFWPPSGIYLTALIWGKYRTWPGVILVALAANVASNLWHAQAVPVSLAFAAANTVEALAGALLLRRFFGPSFTLSSVRQVLGLILSASTAAAAGATAGTATTAVVFGGPLPQTWLAWWVSDMLGILVCVPPALTLTDGLPHSAARRAVRVPEICAFGVALAAVTVFVFRPGDEPLPYRPYVLFLLLLWMAVRFGPRGTTLGVLCVTLCAVALSARGSGPFVGRNEPTWSHLLDLQIFLVVTSSSFLILSVTFSEHAEKAVALRESQRWQHLLVESAPCGMLVVTEDGRVVVANQQLEAMFDYAPGELVGRPVEDLVPARFRAAHPAHRAGFLASPHARPMGAGRDLYGLRKDGTEVPVEVGLNPIRTDAGAFVVASVIDISERKRAEAALKQNEERFRLVAQASNDGLWDVDLLTGACWWNDSYEQLFGPRPPGRDGWNWWAERLHPDDQWHVTQSLDQAMACDESRWTAEYRFLGPGGGYAHVIDRVYLARDPAGKVTRLVGAVIDITGRKNVEAALREAESRFRGLATLAPVGIFQADTRGDCQFVNDHWRHLAGQPGPEAFAESWLGAVHPEDRAAVHAGLRTASGSGAEFASDFRLQTPGGKIAWVSGRVVALRDAVGAVTGYLGSVTDVTERHHQEQRIRAALAEKDTLLKEVHHRVKNNLAIVSGLLNLQADRTPDPAVVGTLRESHNRVHAMAAIHELLYQAGDVSRINASDYVGGLVNNLFSSYGVSRASVRFHLRVVPLGLDLDTAVPLGLIVTELVTNALKHAFPAGRPGNLTLQLGTGADGLIVLSVADDGVGLPPDFDPARARSLGLRLVNRLARQLGGVVAAERTQGTIFHVSFPAPRKERVSP